MEALIIVLGCLAMVAAIVINIGVSFIIVAWLFEKLLP